MKLSVMFACPRFADHVYFVNRFCVRLSSLVYKYLTLSTAHIRNLSRVENRYLRVRGIFLSVKALHPSKPVQLF